MRFSPLAFPIVLASLSLPVSAQCFNRNICNDPSVVEIRSQVSMTIPLAEKATSAEITKTMEDGRRDLYALSSSECESLKGTNGGECTLSSSNVTTTLQDRARGYGVFVSINSTYELKKAAKP